MRIFGLLVMILGAIAAVPSGFLIALCALSYRTGCGFSAYLLPVLGIGLAFCFAGYSLCFAAHSIRKERVVNANPLSDKPSVLFSGLLALGVVILMWLVLTGRMS